MYYIKEFIFDFHVINCDIWNNECLVAFLILNLEAQSEFLS